MLRGWASCGGDVRRRWWLERADAIAGTLALLWVVHPLTTQGVGYTVQRSESLMSLLLLVTLWLALRACRSSGVRRLGWLAAACVACALGMAAKPVMVGVVVLVVLTDRAAVADRWRDTLGGRWWMHGAVALSGWAVLAATGTARAIFETQTTTRRTVGFAYAHANAGGHGPLEHLLTQGEVVLHYLRLVVWPDPLVLDYGWSAVALNAGGGPTAWQLVAVVAVAFLVISSVWLAVFRPAIGLLAMAFFIVLGPTSSVVPVRDVIFEHRMYLPTAAVLGVLVVVASWGVCRAERGGAGRGVVRSRLGRALILGAVLGATTAFGVRTALRSAAWGDPSGLGVWRANVADAPTAPRPAFNLGLALERELDRRGVGASADRVAWDEVVALVRRAVELEPTNGFRTHRLGLLLDRVGVDRKDDLLRDEALVALGRAVELRPGEARYRFSLAVKLDERGRERSARDTYEAVWATDGAHVDQSLRGRAAFNAANWYLRASERVGRASPPDLPGALGHAREAVRWYQNALQAAPEHEQARRGLATARRIATELERFVR